MSTIQIESERNSYIIQYMQPRFLFVGGGLSSALTFKYLSKLLEGKPIHPIYELWERNDTLGGRMNSQSLHLSTNQFWDLGLQYITSTSEDKADPVMSETLNELVSRGLLKPLTDNADGLHSKHFDSEHYMCPNGTASIVTSLLSSPTSSLSTHINVRLNTKIHELTYSPINNTWTALGSDHGELVQGEYDFVILSCTPSDLQNISFRKGEYISNLWHYSADNSSRPLALAQYIEGLLRVQYSKRFALAVSYSPSAWSAMASFPFAFKYIYSDPAIRYISIQNRKEKQDGNAANSLPTEGELPIAMVVHTSVPFAEEHCSSDTVAELIVAGINRVIPGLPPPVEQKLVYYESSQVTHPYLDWKQPFGMFKAAKELSQCDSWHASRSNVGGLVFVGDYFKESKFRNCIISADAAAREIAKLF